MNKLLVCTFSGGRTSAFMGKFLNEYEKYKDYDKVFIFANTGKEPFKAVQDVHEVNKSQRGLFDLDMDMETDCFCKIT